MTLTVFCILLFAALLHASWNAIVKASGDKMYAAIGVSGSAALIALVLIGGLGWALKRTLGGQTGDTLGAAIELGELLFLLALL